MYTHDLISGLTSTSQNNVTTYTVGFGTVGADQEAVDLLNLAADGNHGGGTFNSMKQGYFPATSAQTLSKALTNIINNIFSVNTSFVAPVVPVNPENRLEFGKRVYMGFFFPEANGFWSGNLKKYGLDTNLNVMDKNGQYANYVDSDLNGIDDRDSALLSADATHQAVDGSFRSSATSYWTTGADSPDGGTVAKGGVGEVLMNRSYTISSVISNISGSVRNIYTYTGTSTNLTDATNKFLPNNGAITASLLGLPGPIITSATTTDVKQLVNYVHGFDVYSSNASAVTHKRAWILGDMLHSKPLVVSYAKFDYDNHPSYEADPAKNKNIIYVGTNDGMLHAFNDWDGSEAWAFIPPDLLPNLQYLPGSIHTYFVDGSAQVFKYLKNASADPNNPDDNPTDASVNAGPLSSAKKDSVILLVGLRRGGGVITEPGQGFYYALDVTDPATPKYLWKISNATSGFSDLGEAWSEPKIGQIAVNTGSGTTIKAAAFLGGGYDNCNEDGRFGATQTFSGSCVGVLATADSGLDGSGNPITSSGLVTAATFTTTNAYKGRGVYVVELATLPTSTSINGLDFSNSGSKIWSYTFTNGLQYSMLSEMAAVDLTGDGYVDRLYMGDAGGNMWRFDLSSTLTSNWTVTKIFSSNPGYTNGVLDSSTGRKIFYRPAVVPDQNNKIIRLYFGTGDREHPLNRAVVDRMYGLFDKGINSSGVITGITTAVTEAKLFDVTTDAIQTSTTQAGVDAAKAKLDLASSATDTTTYGWYIRLDSADRNPQVLCNGNPCPGEKVLATAAVASGTVYMTTYSPITAATTTVANPCAGGNLGNSLLYLLDYWSGAAVKNLDATNDSTSSTYNFNKYAFTSGDWTSGKNSVLLRTDRNRHVGSSIPSGAVVICAAGNTNCKWLVGCGGGLCTDTAAPGPGSLVSPVYWRQK
jgi:type IV pilus assembly protein PilY1